MRVTTLTRSLLPLFAAVTAYGACAIQGTVMDILTGRTVPKAQIFVRPHGDEEAVPVRRIAGEAGRFCFEHLEAGDYEIIAKRAGYLEAKYGQSRHGGPGLVLRLAAGQALEPLIVKMTPQAVISGRLVNSDSDPIDRGQVEVLKRAWADGKFQLAPVTRGQTDDQGRFRLAQLAPGTYYLRAQPRREFRRFDLLNDKGEPIRERDVETYYNGAVSAQEATPLALKAGQEIGGLTFSLEKTGGRHVSGRISVALSESDSGWIQIFRDSEKAREIAGRVPIRKDGSFRMDGLAAGQYLLRGNIWRGNTDVQLEKQIDLTAGDADGIVLEPLQLLDFEVRVRVEGATPDSKPPPIQQLFLSGGQQGSGGELQPDGSYKFEGVSPGAYRVELATEGDSYFVKRLVVDGDAQPDRMLDLRTIRPKSIEAILSARVATVRGQISVSRELRTGITVVLQDEANPSEMRSQTAGPNGEFELKSLEPGKYRLYAFEDFDSDLWGSPELAAALAAKSVAVELREGEKRQITVPLISSAEFQSAIQKIGL